MKTGIITFHSAHNYGAVLQAWSLQEYLKQQGHEVNIVNFRPRIIDKMYWPVQHTKKVITGAKLPDKLINQGYYTAYCTAMGIKHPKKYQKFKAFENFINKKLPVTEEFRTAEELKKANLKYDALITGSDQVWNTKMLRGGNPAYFLDFGNEDALRISYAASIGTDIIPPQYGMMFRRYLRNFDCISVRELKAKEQVELYTKKPVELIADPTFLLERKDFDTLKIEQSYKGKYIYVHNVHLKRVDPALNSVAEEMSKRLNLPILHNWSSKEYENEAGHLKGGPGGFIGAIANAEYVITNSFHCTVFAIIYGRNFITVPHFKHPDRMKFLLEQLGIPEHLISKGSEIPEDLDTLKINYEDVESRKREMGRGAQEFLARALASEKKTEKETYFKTGDLFSCYGCGACKDVCPKGAITMERDAEGFLYPKVDESLCVHCHKCRKVCIHKKQVHRNKHLEEFPKVYSASAKDEKILKTSENGGIFTVLSREFTGNGQNVAGVLFGEAFMPEYAITKSAEECEKFRGFKYVEADSKDVKKQTERLLGEGEKVLFSGTPCQIAGLKNYLKKEYENLYTVEISCEGIGSPKVFRQYCDSLEEMYQSKMISYRFADRFKGPDKAYMVAKFESKGIELEDSVTNDLGYALRNNLIQRPSCFTCEFHASKYGIADLTIGELKPTDKNLNIPNENGLSVLKVNTEKGWKLFEQIKEQLQVEEIPYEAAFEPKAAGFKESRSCFMYLLDQKPIDELLNAFNKRKNKKNPLYKSLQ